MFRARNCDPEGVCGRSGRTGRMYESCGGRRVFACRTSGGTDGKADIPAPQIAWFLEFGVQPHYTVSGIRARKFPVTEDSKVGFHKGIAPTPFISSAFDTKLDEAYSHLIRGLDLLIEKSIS